MKGRKITGIYALFYFLISNDTWRILGGLIAAFLFAPSLCQSRQEELSIVGKVMIWIMIAVLGWSVSFWPASKISKGLQNTIKKLMKST